MVSTHSTHDSHENLAILYFFRLHHISFANLLLCTDDRAETITSTTINYQLLFVLRTI